MSSTKVYKKGFAGILAETFINSQLTPVIAIVSILLGIFSVVLTPKEEEPQISVPMIDIQIPAPGLSPEEVERKVTEPIERGIWGLDGVEYVYSMSEPHGALITVRFKVGEPIEPSLLKVHHKLMEVKSAVGDIMLTPQIKSFSIDDVPFLTLTFSSDTLDDYELRTQTAPLARELSSTPDLSKVELLGGRKKTIRVIVNPELSKGAGVNLLDIATNLKANDSFIPAGKNWSDTHIYDIEIGGRVKNIEDVGRIPIAQRGGRVVRIKDVAKIEEGPEERRRLSLLYDKELGNSVRSAVSIVFSKRKGTNVVILAKQLLERADIFKKELPSDIKLSIVRNYGLTAEEKSHELIEHLLIATFSVTILIAIWMGIRAAIVVSIAIPVTLALTLAIYYFMGYTLNRVTLFALIFSIGILVDDAIVVVENIERHLALDPTLGIIKATINAVSEVGNPTILATFTVIGAILPMAFVRGLMGPYMKPIPVGASLAMILSLFVAFIVTPWASVRLLKHHHSKESDTEHPEETKLSLLDRLYVSFVNHLLTVKSSTFAFGFISIFLLLSAGSLVYFKAVKVKMLPFDNKNEFQILIDYPTFTSRDQAIEMTKELSIELLKNNDIKKVQIFSGEAAPYSFSGMVKHTFLRNKEYMNDLQIVLSNKDERKKSSHQIIEEARIVIDEFRKKSNSITKILEIPPGPPVMATMVAEIYGPDRQTRDKIANEIFTIFKNEKSVCDLDSSMREGRERLIYKYNHGIGGELGTRSLYVGMTGNLIFSESSILSLAEASHPEDISIDLSVENKDRSGESPFKNHTIASFETGIVPIDSVVREKEVLPNYVLYRKNLKPVSYVFSELSGAEEAPVYGIMKLSPQIKYETQTAEVPWNTTSPVIKWDGEWFITYEVFRDLGGAFGVVMILIYILVLGWFRSYLLPLIIMTPIPISLIGILPGHYLMGAYFTATSMIGFIAGAGIIVRNSIILVDFIEQEVESGADLKEAVVNAGVVRFRPMLLTAAAVVVGSFIMLFDPIFQGLAVSLMFGEIAATVISRFAVPLLYYWVAGKSRQKFLLTNKEV